MGTHPIFESDFDCLTDCKSVHNPKWLLLRSPARRPRRLATLSPSTALTQSRMVSCRLANSRTSSSPASRSRAKLATSAKMSSSPPARPRSTSTPTLLLQALLEVLVKEVLEGQQPP